MSYKYVECACYCPVPYAEEGSDTCRNCGGHPIMNGTPKVKPKKEKNTQKSKGGNKK